MNILIVRLSSMGDIVQTLPALTDAAKHIPNVRFDWVVDESFADVPLWHPNVDEVIICNHRKWRRNLGSALVRGEIQRFIKKLRKKKYDYVIDVQNGLKSAAVTLLAKGIRCGYDKHSVKEWGAHWAYHKNYFVPTNIHTITRMRLLLAQALNYKIDGNELPSYDIDQSRLEKIPIEISRPYLVFVHFASWESKVWPEAYWKRLIEISTRQGYFIVLPWGDELELQRALRLASDNPYTMVLPPLSISQKANIIAQAAGVVGCDTGLSHVAAALETPTITLHGPTDPELGGGIGKNLQALMANFACLKCDQGQCHFDEQAKLSKISTCFLPLTPEFVWSQLQGIMNPRKTVHFLKEKFDIC